MSRALTATLLGLAAAGTLAVHASVPPAAGDTHLTPAPGWTVTVLQQGSDFWGANAAAVNERGQVVGGGLVSDSPTRAFLWDAGKMVRLGVLAGAPSDGASSATAINDNTQVVGWSSSGNGASHAVLWQHGKIADLGTLPHRRYSEAIGINASGQIIGNSYASRDRASGAVVGVRAFLWERGRLRDLGTLGGASASAAAINDHGQIVGWSDTRGGARHAFLWQKGRMRDLGTLSGTKYCEAVALNAHGEVVGSCYTALRRNPRPSGFQWPPGEPFLKADLRGFIVRHGRITPVTPPDASPSITVAISDNGQVIGDTVTKGSAYPAVPHAFTWHNGRATFLSIPRGATTSAALAINAHDQIVGWAGVEGAYEAYVWAGSTRTPLPNPGGAGYDDKVSASAITDTGKVSGTRTATMDSASALLWSQARR